MAIGLFAIAACGRFRGKKSVDASIDAPTEASVERAGDAAPEASSASGDAGDDASAEADAPEDAAPPAVERIPVPKDRPAVLVRGNDPGVVRTVFIPGICSNATVYLKSFPEAARAHGGVLAIDGEKPCGRESSGFRSFVYSPLVQKNRLLAAVAAAGLKAPEEGFTLVGYSAGASLAQFIHAKWPKLFPRVVIIAPPDDPDLNYLVRARAVVTMSCSRDVPQRMSDAARRLGRLEVPAKYIEMPGCLHGDVADAERVFGEAFDFLDGHR